MKINLSSKQNANAVNDSGDWAGVIQLQQMQNHPFMLGQACNGGEQFRWLVRLDAKKGEGQENFT